MHTQNPPYRYVPQPIHETKWHFGWNSCLLFIASLALLALYVVMPGIPLRFVWAGITLIASLGIISAMLSIIFGQFWLSKVYAVCGLIGNVCMMLWLLLSL